MSRVVVAALALVILGSGCEEEAKERIPFLQISASPRRVNTAETEGGNTELVTVTLSSRQAPDGTAVGVFIEDFASWVEGPDADGQLVPLPEPVRFYFVALVNDEAKLGARCDTLGEAHVVARMLNSKGEEVNQADGKFVCYYEDKTLYQLWLEVKNPVLRVWACTEDTVLGTNDNGGGGRQPE